MKIFILGLILFSALQASAVSIKIEVLNSNTEAGFMSCDPNPGQCKVVDQSGTIESWECRNSTGKIRCYADVQYENGTKLRIWGGCYDSYGDCWGSGEGKVEACD
jgi:hypothetical protein